MTALKKKSQEATLLVVEDDDVDAMAVERAMRKKRILNPVVRAIDGQDALEKLRTRDAVRRPFIILLDINMPRMNGIEFIDKLLEDNDLSLAPVFVMTTSSSDADRFAAYERHVAGYIVKSDIAESFLDVVDMIDHYWRVVELPYSD